MGSDRSDLRVSPVYKAAAALFADHAQGASIGIITEGAGSLEFSAVDDEFRVEFPHDPSSNFELYTLVDRDAAYEIAALLLAWADSQDRLDAPRPVGDLDVALTALIEGEISKGRMREILYAWRAGVSWTLPDSMADGLGR